MLIKWIIPLIPVEKGLRSGGRLLFFGLVAAHLEQATIGNAARLERWLGIGDALESCQVAVTGPRAFLSPKRGRRRGMLDDIHGAAGVAKPHGIRRGQHG